jgi:hypothetical protein
LINPTRCSALFSLKELEMYLKDITEVSNNFRSISWVLYLSGFIVSKKIKHLILDFQAKSHRIRRLRIKGKFLNYSLICAHSPTEDKSDEEKDSLYDELDERYGECPQRECKIIIGDMNAKVGKEQIYRPIIGKQPT